MKRFAIELSQKALDDIREISEFYSDVHPATLKAWIDRLHATIRTLTVLPNRNAVIREVRRLNRPLREILHGRGRSKWRVIYEVVEDTVRVHHIRRVSRKSIQPDDLA